MPKQKFVIGDKVKREIEGQMFGAVVERLRGNYVDIRYFDDGNLEANVPVDEIRFASENDDPDLISPRSGDSGKSGLPRPLVGLIEDDYETRKAQLPTVVVHEENQSDGVIVLNGAENKLAAGGGLRALRYLK